MPLPARRLRDHGRRPLEACQSLGERVGSERALAVGQVLRLVPVRVGDVREVDVEGRAEVQPLLEKAITQHVEVEQVIPRHETLEELFVREAIAGPDQRAAS